MLSVMYMYMIHVLTGYYLCWQVPIHSLWPGKLFVYFPITMIVFVWSKSNCVFTCTAIFQ